MQNLTKNDFIQNLRKALAGMVDYRIANENISYYEDYIDTQIRKGRTEEEVLSKLGDPRLLAKTIIETAGSKPNESMEQKDAESERMKAEPHVFRMPGWLFLCIVLGIVLLVFWVIGSVVSFLLPIAVPVLLLWMLIRFFRRRG